MKCWKKIRLNADLHHAYPNFYHFDFKEDDYVLFIDLSLFTFSEVE